MELDDTPAALGSTSASPEAFIRTQATSANTSRFIFTLSGYTEELRVLDFELQEFISAPYQCRVTLATQNNTLDEQTFLAQAGLLTLIFNDRREYLHGEVAGFEYGHEQGDYFLYQVRLVPKFWFLGKRTNQRIFQQLSVPQIIEQVFNEAGITARDYELRLGDSYPPRDYCVQYNESELDFLSRLMEQEGLHYHYEHRNDGHIMVISDQNNGFLPIQGDINVQYHPQSGLNEQYHVIQSLSVRQQTCFDTARQRDYNFIRPSVRLEQSLQSESDTVLEDYYYPGDYLNSTQGQRRTRLILQQHQAHEQQRTFNSNHPNLRAGTRFRLNDHPDTDLPQDSLLVQIIHTGSQPQALDEYGAGQSAQYHNEALAVPLQTPWRPQPKTSRPLIAGYHSAVVTGPGGEEIYTNEHAQNKVQFPWDREGQLNEQTSCWLRSTQGWAGNRWGTLILPRIGQETKIGFIHGNPDKPLITGRLYHELNRPPYALPAHKTRATFKSDSTLGGAGYNEIRIEDKSGAEQVFFHAEKDLDIRAKNDRRDIVQNDRHLIVDNNRYEHIRQNSHHSIAQNQNEKTGADQSFTIGTSQHEQAGQAVMLAAAGNIHLKSGQKIVLEAGTELTIKAGGGFIKIDPSGITAQGARIDFNSGTGGSPAAAARPQTPLLAAEADKDRPGQSFKPTEPQQPPEPKTIRYKGTIARELLKPEPHPLAPLPREPEPPKEKQYWLKLEHTLSYPDDKGQQEPAKRASYLLTAPDGQQLSGQLDDAGQNWLPIKKPGIYQVEYEPDIDKEIAQTQKEIQQILNAIIKDEQKEAQVIEKKLNDARYFGLDFPGSNALAQYEIYKIAAAKGFWNGLKGLAVFAWDMLKGAGKLVYELALRTNPITAPYKFREDLKALKAAHKELQQFADEDLELYAALISDKETLTILKDFAGDYLQVQHPLEYTETGGQVVFDILLTIVTAGFGAAASIRHLGKLKKLKPLMQQLKKLLKRRRAKGQFKGVQNSRIDSKNVLKSDSILDRSIGAKSKNLSQKDIDLARSTGKTAKHNAARKKIASAYYEKQRMPKAKIEGHMMGIDFNKPVEVVVLPKDKLLYQYQVPNGPQGYYYTEPGVKPSSVGISSKAKDWNTGKIVKKQVNVYKTIDKIEVLQSSAAKIDDTWSIPGETISTDGGGIQYFIMDSSVISGK